MAEVALEQEISKKPLRTIDDLCQKILAEHPNLDLSLIEKAYHFAEKAHAGQIRRSGEPYFFHPLCVAGILAELKLDLASIATGLLHDTIEDTSVTVDQIEAEFGNTIASLVDGVTKISKIHFRNTHEKQGENIRKMIVAMGKDIRVVLVKLADRLHNMRTLNHMPPEKQLRIAQETLDIYAPLASRLGISSIKIELEDSSFRYLLPETYYDLIQQIAKQSREREKYIDEVKKLITKELTKHKFKFEVQGRPKHLYSIYRKMQSRNIEFDQVHDLLAFRVIVQTVTECYEVLGLMHSLWKPIPGRFKDFIAMPKTNNYQSLHTTVFGPDGERIEIQIRTQEMHLVAERGIAAHWSYKEGKSPTDNSSQRIEWLRELVSLHQTVRDPDEFLETVKTDLFESEIYVFTPKGEVKEFPEGATPIDFAFSVHTDVGNTCVAARVNGKLVPLKTPLSNGDTIEIVTSKNQHPSKDWLEQCVTTRAKSKIRWYIKDEQRKRAKTLGKELLEKAFRKAGASPARYLKGTEFEQYLKEAGTPTLDDLYIQIGYGKLIPSLIVERLAPAEIVSQNEEPTSFLAKVFQSALTKSKKESSVIHVDGMDDVLVRFGKCCNPIPGDPIVGFISRGRGITIHTASCSKAFGLDQERQVDVEWAAKIQDGVGRMAKIRVVSHDIQGLLNHMTEVFNARGVNIHNAQIRTTKDKRAVCVFDLNVKNTTQLSQVMQDLQKIKGILGVTRMTRL